MFKLFKLVIMTLVILVATGCVSRYSTNQYGNKVVLKDNEMNQAITTEINGARFLGKVDRIINGVRMKAYVYEKGSDYIFVGSANMDDYTKASIKTTDLSPELAEALSVEFSGLNIRNFPWIDRAEGRCALALMNVIPLNDKVLLAVYIDRTALSNAECTTVQDVEGFYALYPERAQQFVAKASQTLSIIE